MPRVTGVKPTCGAHIAMDPLPSGPLGFGSELLLLGEKQTACLRVLLFALHTSPFLSLVAELGDSVLSTYSIVA